MLSTSITDIVSFSMHVVASSRTHKNTLNWLQLLSNGNMHFAKENEWENFLLEVLARARVRYKFNSNDSCCRCPPANCSHTILKEVSLASLHDAAAAIY